MERGENKSAGGKRRSKQGLNGELCAGRVKHEKTTHASQIVTSQLSHASEEKLETWIQSAESRLYGAVSRFCELKQSDSHNQSTKQEELRRLAEKLSDTK